MPRGHQDIDLSGHARFEFELRILNAEDHIVGHHVLHGFRDIADLPDAAIEGFAGVGINVKKGRLANVNFANIRFADIRIEFHLSQRLRNEKQGGCLQAGGHGLADIDV